MLSQKKLFSHIFWCCLYPSNQHLLYYSHWPVYVFILSFLPCTNLAFNGSYTQCPFLFFTLFCYFLLFLTLYSFFIYPRFLFGNYQLFLVCVTINLYVASIYNVTSIRQNIFCYQQHPITIHLPCLLLFILSFFSCFIFILFIFSSFFFFILPNTYFSFCLFFVLYYLYLFLLYPFFSFYFSRPGHIYCQVASVECRYTFFQFPFAIYTVLSFPSPRLATIQC